jgi:hypothetical protein
MTILRFGKIFPGGGRNPAGRKVALPIAANHTLKFKGMYAIQ